MTVSRKALFPEKYNLMRAQEMCTILSLWEREQNDFTFNEFLQVMICAKVWTTTCSACGVNDGTDVVVNCEQPQLLSSLPVWKLKEWYWLLHIFWYVAAKASSDMVRELILF